MHTQRGGGHLYFLDHRARHSVAPHGLCKVSNNLKVLHLPEIEAEAQQAPKSPYSRKPGKRDAFMSGGISRRNFEKTNQIGFSKLQTRAFFVHFRGQWRKDGR
jgi:hypothetical protein